MPCPFFEPTQPVRPSTHAQARLPLIDEYDGLCMAGDVRVAAPAGLRFRFCNHGYSRLECPSFPPSETRSALRYSVVRETMEALEILCIEERDHIPAWRAQVRFSLAAGDLAENDLPAAMQAQVLAFCRSYRERCLRT